MWVTIGRVPPYRLLLYTCFIYRDSVLRFCFFLGCCTAFHVFNFSMERRGVRGIHIFWGVRFIIYYQARAYQSSYLLLLFCYLVFNAFLGGYTTNLWCWFPYQKYLLLGFILYVESLNSSSSE